MVARTKRITEKNLLPGDILLSCGEGWLSDLIRAIDRGRYSHSGIWDGAYSIDATRKGVKRNTLDFVLKAQRFVDAYRWRTLPPELHYLGDAAYPYLSVWKQADSIVKAGPKFAYDELVMAALVIAASNIPTDPVLRFAARVVLSQLEDWIHKILTSGKRTMMCTEVVCTSFWLAVPKGHYAIHIRVGASRAARLLWAASHPVPRRTARLGGATLKASRSDYEELRRECARLLLQAAGRTQRQHIRKAAGASGGVLEPAGGPLVPLGCVTPHDLEHSPNLDFVGRLS